MTQDRFNVKFGRNVKRRREKLGMTQTELAAHIGTVSQNVGLVERGIHAVQLVRFRPLCRALKTTPDKLLRGC